MAYDDGLAQRIREYFDDHPYVSEKAMFGGVAFLLSGNICVAMWQTSLVVRVGAKVYENALQKPHAQAFDITGKSMRGWVVVHPEGISEDQ